MTSETRSELEVALQWLAYTEWSKGVPHRYNLSDSEWESDQAIREEHGWWACDAVFDMLMYDPERLWRVVLLMVEHATEETLGNVAAGPLEDLLGDHSPLFLERVEERSGADPKFRRCLGGVWGWTSIPRDLWPRLHAVGLWPSWDGSSLPPEQGSP